MQFTVSQTESYVKLSAGIPSVWIFHSGGKTRPEMQVEKVHFSISQSYNYKTLSLFSNNIQWFYKFEDETQIPFFRCFGFSKLYFRGYFLEKNNSFFLNFIPNINNKSHIFWRYLIK